MGSSLQPKISVLMPAYNGARYLRASVKSILTQTFRDIEFLIILDPSSDKSEQIIDSFQDSRLHVVKNDHRLGLIQSLNFGLQMSRGEYVARMDADDISAHDRLAKQVSYMENHRDIGVCGTDAILLQSSQKKSFRGILRDLTSLLFKKMQFCDTHSMIQSSMISTNPMIHPSVMIRKEVLITSKAYYSPQWKFAEDYELWTRLINYTKFANLRDRLLYYRMHTQNVSTIMEDPQRQNALKIMRILIEKLQIIPSEKEMTLHYEIAFSKIQHMKEWVLQVERWLLKLYQANDRTKIMPKKEFQKVLVNIWAMICITVRCPTIWIWKIFWNSKLHPISNLNLTGIFMVLFRPLFQFLRQ